MAAHGMHGGLELLIFSAETSCEAYDLKDCKDSSPEILGVVRIAGTVGGPRDGKIEYAGEAGIKSYYCDVTLSGPLVS